jgi:hypothetical protein
MAAGTSALLIAIGGGVAGVAALTRDGAKPHVVTAVGDSAAPGATASEAPSPVPPLKGAVATRARTAAEADRSASRNPVREPVPVEGRPPAKAQPSPEAPAAGASAGLAGQAGQVVTTRTEVETREIPYPTRTVRDPGLPSGSKRVQTPGVAGEETLRYLVTVTDGKPTDRRLLDSTVTRQPQQEIVALGAQNGQKGCPLDFCVPLGRDATCRHYRRDESGQMSQSSQAGGSGQVSVTGNDVALLGGGHGDGEAGDGHWGGGHGEGGRGGHGGRGRGC